jgi:hypothetical protein
MMRGSEGATNSPGPSRATPDPEELHAPPRLLLKRNTTVQLRGEPSCVSPSILAHYQALDSQRSTLSFSWRTLSSTRSQLDSDDADASEAEIGTSLIVFFFSRCLLPLLRWGFWHG